MPLAATGRALPWPAPESLALKFVAHHLYDADEKARDPRHGMPEDVQIELRPKGLLRTEGPQAQATVRRRLSSWATLQRMRGEKGPFKPESLRSEVASLKVKQLIEEDPVPADPGDPSSSLLPCMTIQLGRAQTLDAEAGAQMKLVGRPVKALTARLKSEGIQEGAIFRRINRWENVRNEAMTAGGAII